MVVEELQQAEWTHTPPHTQLGAPSWQSSGSFQGPLKNPAPELQAPSPACTRPQLHTPTHPHSPHSPVSLVLALWPQPHSRAGAQPSLAWAQGMGSPCLGKPSETDFNEETGEAELAGTGMHGHMDWQALAYMPPTPFVLFSLCFPMLVPLQYPLIPLFYHLCSLL